MRNRRHFHKRQSGNEDWDKFVEGFGDFVNDLNPFEDDVETAKVVAKAPATVFKTVFETLSQTFDGEIGGWSTVGADGATETDPAIVNATPTADVVAAQTTNADREQTTAVAQQSTSRGSLATLPESLIPTNTEDLGDHTTLALATSKHTGAIRPTGTATRAATDSTTSASTALGGAISASSSPTAASSSTSTSSSAGTKAGIAFGVLGGILVVGLLVWFLFNKRKSQMEKHEQMHDNEKINGAFTGRPLSFQQRPVSVLTSHTSETAPQLSLRPVNTDLMPTFSERRSSKGAAMALNLTSNQIRGPPAGNSTWERPTTGHNNHPDNPFRDNANPTQTPEPRNPFNAPENVVGMAASAGSLPRSSPAGAAGPSGPGANAAIGAGAALAAPGPGLARKTSMRKESPAPLDLTLVGPMSPMPPSPAGTEFSQSELPLGQSPGPSQGAAAIAAAGGPAQTVVHRVQLDFNPTLEDEMGLKAGQLVRLLHEYDDGWVSSTLESTESRGT